MFKNSILFGCIIFFASISFAQASDWWLLTNQNGASYYMDTDSIEDLESYGLIKVWVKTIYQKKRSLSDETGTKKIYNSEVSLINLDCIKGKMRATSVVYYYQKTDVAGARDESAPMHDVIPDSSGDWWLKSACKVWVKKNSDK